MLKRILLLTIFLAWLICLIGAADPADGTGFDDDIMEYVLTKKTPSYKKEVRPTAKVNVSFQISYRQLVSLDEKTQILTSNIYLYANWLDERLSWDPQNYSGLSEIVIPITKLWFPDFAIVNSADSNVFITINDSILAILTNDGYVFITIPITSLKTKCKVNVYKFPFDSQNCPITIGSWQLDTNRINFISDESKISLTDYTQSAVWVLKDITVKSQQSNARYQTVAKELKNEDVSFTVMIKRRPLYYITSFIPCFILNFATLLAFFVNNAIVVQVNLCMSTFLTFGVYSLKISGDITTQSEYLLLANLYFIVAIFYTIISMTWFICANYYTTRNRLPRWMAFIAKYVKIVLFCIFPRVKPSPKPIESEEKLETIESNNTSNLRKRTIIYEQLPKLGCNKCEMCKDCESNKDKENTKKKAKELLDSNILALNYLVFFIVFLIMLITNLCIWLSASSS